jgi:hypothetical protein
MKKFLITALCILLLSTGISTPTYAATDGCPQNWNIDASQYPNSELESVKVTLGRNIVVTESTEYSPKDNSWVKMPFYNSRYFPWIDQLPQRKIVKVEVKDCPARSFIFPVQANSALPLQDISAAEWAEKNPTKFGNFKAAEEWVASISTYKEFIIKTSERFNNGKSNGFEKLNIDVRYPNPGYVLLIFNQECGTELITPTVFRLKQGTKCQLGIGTEGVIFERFEIQNGNLNSSVVCVKGKTQKTVKGTNPKCPKGYKVKV